MRVMLLSLAFVPLVAAAAPENSPEPPVRVAELDWLIGRWVGEGLGGEIEEVFLPARGGAMPGTFRLIRGEAAAFYEFILIEDSAEGVEMRLHHFNPGMSRWEDEPVTFDLIERGETKAVFAERDDETEQTRLDYQREGDELTVRLTDLVEGERVVKARFSFRLVERFGARPPGAPGSG